MNSDNHTEGYTYKYPHPAVTTDCVVFGFDGKELLVLLIQRGLDPYKGMWAFPGGFLRMDETAEECAKRELKEETGLEVIGLRLRGIITFILPDWGNELTFLYTAKTDTAETLPCSEGTLAWIPISKIPELPLWEGDRIFLPLLQSRQDCFSLKLIYAPGGALTSYALDGGTAISAQI